ncbi:hypothetical protein D7Y27_34350 [Corallococcus sp. AB004]|uniref:hypothetical protein n=1 Tax=Corallococcus TaxID=83461 RepID=UPI000EA3520C|nr:MULTISPECIES: hypothetical protein [Corallococcus]RKI33698.1 hypothetical protein D7Y27_34350 [Corallococcus sp. AB004]NPC71954.1 hypothetical protein [Corallococcus exiguus]NPD25747.1 hypothetical protein [Corallococcus exiguus]NRD49629.1 hypothetical protein [Corallococcus exiguus]RKI04850.1 hypothetical protein D7Y04_08125 [Corallococcus sp. AB038B]
MHPQPAFHLPPWLFFVMFPVIFVLVSYVLAAMGGWRRLARDYRLDKGGGFPCRSFVSGEVGGVSYGNCLTLGGDARGLYLAAFFLFRLGHPPLCIPWADVHDRVRERRLFLFSWDTFSVGPDRVKLRIPSSDTAPLDSYLPAIRQA